MPFRVSCGPSEGRTIIVSHSATEALTLYLQLQENGEQNIEIGHLELGPLTVKETEVMATAEPAANPG